VWAKSHGSFTEILPMYSDVHNLKPCDASINNDRGNKDFDEGGVAHQEAIGCYYTSSTWEPRDQDKGDIARIILYMAVRYEGGNNEIDLEAVDRINTSPNPEHGRLSTLLEWNLQDLPDAFEVNRNNQIAAWQKNRNPFVDHPEFAQLIWGSQAASLLTIGDINAYPPYPEENQEVIISSDIKGEQGNITAVLEWGYSKYALFQSVPMEITAGRFIGEISGQPAGTVVYFRIVATDEGGQESESVTYSLETGTDTSGPFISIYDLQGQQEESPYLDQNITATGIVTAFFGEYYFLQQSSGAWTGLVVSDPGRDVWIGDSLLVSGTIIESDGITTLADVTACHLVSRYNGLPDPLIITCAEADESMEGVLIQVVQALCTNDDYESNDWMWTVTDDSGSLYIHNTAICEYDPSMNELYTVTGPLHQVSGDHCIELRSGEDVFHVQDTDPPVVESIEVLNATTVKILFSENMEKQSAETESNYSINKGVTVLDANQQTNIKRNIYLNLSALSNGEYELTVQNVKDMSGNVIITANYPFSFTNGVPGYGDGSRMVVHQSPADEKVMVLISAKKSDPVILSVIGGDGRNLMEREIEVITGENQFSLDLEGYPAGIYLIFAEGPHYRMSTKIIHQ
jgi:hypothetical protein